MESKIARAIHLKHHPVALMWSNEKPGQAMHFHQKKWGCVMWLIAHAAKGKTSVCDIKTFGCVGAGVGLGFGKMKPLRPFVTSLPLNQGKASTGRPAPGLLRPDLSGGS